MRIWATILTASLALLPLAPANAQRISITSADAQGKKGAVPQILVWSGNTTAIDFSSLGETITQIVLADPSRITYITDGKSTIFLRRIKPLSFPTITTASTTNLIVKTNKNLYTFALVPTQGTPTYSVIAVSQRLTPPSLRLADIERGLMQAIGRGYTHRSDPVVAKVRQFLRIAQAEGWEAALEQTGINPEILQKLAQMGAIE